MGKAELLRAFDEIHFGPDRTLNLRDSLPTAADARFRAESWLRQRQAISADSVLIVTGRGKGSPEGVPVVKQAVIALLHALRRQGVVKSWQEHSQGAIVIEPASMSALLSALPRHRDQKRAQLQSSPRRPETKTVSGLAPETEKVLRLLAERTLSDLGVLHNEDFIESEMANQMSMLIRGLPEEGDREAALRAVIIRAIEEIDARRQG